MGKRGLLSLVLFRELPSGSLDSPPGDETRFNLAGTNGSLGVAPSGSESNSDEEEKDHSATARRESHIV